MTLLVAGLVLFFASHAVPMIPAVADGARRAFGAQGRKGIVAVGSLAGLVVIVWGKAVAPLDPVWAPPAWGRSVAHALMPIAFVLLAAAYAPGNRIRTVVRNPMLAAVILWSLAHLAANGDLASLLLFGGFLGFAVVDWWSVSRRPPPGTRPGTIAGDLGAIAIGLIAFAVVLFAHPYLFGVAAA